MSDEFDKPQFVDLGLAKSIAHAPYCRKCDSPAEFDLPGDECVCRHGFDAEVAKNFRGKILQIVCHNRSSGAFDGTGEHVTILYVRQD